MQSLRRIALLFLLGFAGNISAYADGIISADLQIQGVGLRVITVSASTGIDIPATVQTEFGGKQNDDAPNIEGLLAVGELSGPGVDTPIRLETAPGHKFQIPGLAREGVYFLQNIRLMKGSEFLQAATPSVATITVSNLLQTTVKVRQLTPEELRARGITIDERNFEVFEYTFSFFVDGKVIEIPFPVVIDKRTHEVRPVTKEAEYTLPPIKNVVPPRWSPPGIEGFELGPGADFPAEEDKEKGGGGRPSIPAALVIPNNLAVLHQFFAVTLMVTNGAPDGSSVTLDSVNAIIKTPAELRTVKSMPPVAFNQPVPIVDPTTGVTFLVAQAKGSAEWTLEGLKPGTHTLEVEVHATYKSPGQADFPLKGTVRSTIVVHDPRFNINFSHPDTVRKGVDYSTYSFITNMSAVPQTIHVTNLMQACSVNPTANVCRLDETPEFVDLTIPPGEMRMVEYKLRPGITGHVFASAGSVSDDNITAAVQLFMGVSESGIPLSPVTLLMPYYARYVSQDLISPNLQLLGLGYSLATAPLTQALASHPRVIKTDVFARAVDIARAGQRIYLGEDPRDSMAHMSLDLLGNAVELREWDDLRRQEKSGRAAGASVVRELEKGANDVNAFVTRFASTTAHRAGYTLAVVQGPAELSVKALPSGAMMSVANEAAAGWVRNVPYGDLSNFKNGQIAMVGRWGSTLELGITPSATGSVSLDLIYPNTNDGSLLRAHVDINGVAGKKLTLTIDRGNQQLNVLDDLGGIAAVASVVTVQPDPIRLIGARQDMHLDDQGHKVSVLFNRPVKIADGDDWLTKFHAQILLNKDGVNYTGNRPMSAAALQGDERVVNVTFDHALSQNASYSMTVDPVLDPLTGIAVNFSQPLTPVIDNDRPGGIIFGHVMKGDNTPIANAEVVLQPEGARQFDLSAASDGSFLFEFVPRDIDNGIQGTYVLRAVTTEGKETKVEGAVRLPGRVHFVNLIYLGRGSAQGYVRYDNGQVVANAHVVIGSTMFDQFRNGTTDATGFYKIEDLPVGPLTFSATDADGNVTFGASEIKTPGQVLVKDLSIYRRPFPGVATVRGIVLRSDTNAPVPGAHVGVYSQGYGLIDGFTDSAGKFEFTKVPTGFVTVLASEWSVSRESVALDFDLANDETRNVTMTLNVAPSVPLAAVEGDVVRENPLYPGDASKYEKVAGALVKIDKGQAVTADANGHFVYQPVPTSFAGHAISAYDPLSTRSASTVLPLLDPTKVNNVPIFISTASGYGEGTIRVRVYNAAGFPVSGLRVIEPGYPPTVLEESGAGVYQLTHVPVGSSINVWAISTGGTYGNQFAQGSARVEFNGHVASLNLRLGGQGTVRVKLVADIDVIGDVKISYPVWDEEEQGLGSKDVVASTAKNGVADYAVFDKVPAATVSYSVASQHPVYGYAGANGKLGFDGDVQSITLQLNKLSTVRGYVYAIDGRTPVAGAIVHIEDGRQNQGTYATLPDGSFVFFNEPASTGFRVVAEITQDGVYRTGYGSGTTPALGGPVNNVSVILRTQGSVDGKIVYAGFKKFDPANPANNIVDDTPNDLSDNAPVPLAKFQLREFDFPSRTFGTTADPLAADAQGRFSINNLFTGPLRVTASDPNNQENRGSWTGTLSQEGERLTAYVGIGTTGFGSVTVNVTDPNNLGAAVYNAEVTIYRGQSVFDFATTDGNGLAHFDQLPVGSYSAAAYSKALGRSGSTTASFNISANTDTPVRIDLVFSGKVTGKLSDPEAGGAGIPGAPVTLSAFNYSTRTSTEVSGDFLFEGVREGTFSLDAKDTLTNRRAHASRNLSQADPEPYVSLELEPTETLYTSVYLPADNGGNSNILASLVNIDVTQRGNEYMRSLQGNSFQMPGLFRNWPYNIYVKEIGGAGREIRYSGSFPTGNSANPLKLVFPAYGNVEVHVMQASSPAVNARVTVSGGGRSVTVYTDASGVAVASGIGLGTVYVQAVTVDGAFSGSGTTTLSSQSTPAVVSLTLGAYAGVTGYVEAEAGGPAVGTRVIASFGRVLEVLTDSNGRYTFQGIPTNTGVSLVYMGPDDVTVGARQSYFVTLNDASKLITLPNVRLDATPPQLVSFFPADGSQNVSPDATLRFIFSEQVASNYINNSFFQLVPADSSSALNCAFSAVSNADGTYTITMTPPPAAPGEQFPLKSNTLYRIIVSGEVRDLTGNKMPATRGGSFITSDYAEPHVIKVTPAVNTPLQAATTFGFTFNEPIDAAPWQTGGNGQFHLYKISAAGPGGTILAEKPGRAYVDPTTGLTLNFAPDDPIEQQSFYRVVFSGVRDLQGNPAPQQTFHFFSFDLNKPVVAIISPVPDTFPLISGVQYTLKLTLTNTDGTPATDVARVDYFRMDGTAQTFLYTTTTSPFSYTFVGPDVPEGGSTLTLRAIATDQSANISEPATTTWQVKPNKPPQNVAVALTPQSAYASNRVNASVSFDDEGTFATVQIDASGTQSDGSAWTKSLVKQLTRLSVDVPWQAASFDFDLPATLKEGTTATFSAAVTDVRGQKGTASSTLTVLADAVNPAVISVSPAAETRYGIGTKYQIVALVGDNESGVKSVTFAFDGQVITVPATNTTLVIPGVQPRTWSYSSGQITVPAKNVDTRIPITITATDYHGNTVSTSVEIVYIGVNDPTVPKGAWLCPVDKATFPAASSLPVTLQVKATDDIAVTAVKFVIPGVTDPVVASRVGTTDTYQAAVTLTTPAAGTAYSLTAIVSDASTEHDVQLTIPIELVTVDISIDDRTQAVISSDVATYQGKSILVRGPVAKFVPHVPLTLKNLIVLNGARVETLSTTTTVEQKLDLTISDHLYVDCASSIDVSARGYLGGWGVNSDGSNTKNNNAAGMTAGNSAANGPTPGASASYAGLGGERNGGVTNAPYGSLTAPFDLGTGGAGGGGCCQAGGSGGGAIRLTGGTQPADLGIFVIAGNLRADGGTGVGTAEAGSGGSINVTTKQFIAGPLARVTANGGDDDPNDQTSRGAGGGRIAINAADRFSADTIGLQIQARGGRNNTSAESASYLDGGAGTIFTKRPGQSFGELTVSSYDERFPTSLHLTRPTPLGAVHVDRLELGARALLRADGTLQIGATTNDRTAATIDPTALLVLPGDQPTINVTPSPASGSTLVQGATIAPSYSAASTGGGIGVVTLAWTPVTPNRVDNYFTYPATAAANNVSLAIPATTPAGSATLTITATDRAGRSVSSSAIPYTIAVNQPAVIDKFLVAPLSLYPGKSVTATVSASDELAVTKLTLTSTINNGTPAVQTKTPNTATVTDSVFTIAIPIDTPGDAPMTLVVGAEDNFPGHAATTQTTPVTILKDTNAPSLTVTSPVANTLYLEGTGATIPIRATATDLEVGVKTAYVQLDGGAQIPLTGSNGAFNADIPVPSVDGSDTVTKQIVVTVKDYEGNTRVSDPIAIQIKPLFDPNAPVVAWSCPSPGALFPAAYSAKLRMYAIGNNVGNQQNGVQKVEFFINESATPITGAPVSGLANYYEASFPIPSDATPGTTFTVRGVATNTAGLSSDVSSSFAVVTGTKITANTTISASDVSYDNKVVIVQSGTTTIAGTHTFDTLIVLDGATVTHPATDAVTTQKLPITTTKALFVSCTGSIDVSGRGYLANATYPGASAPGFAGGGSHIGVGGYYNAALASTYGSLYQPSEAGGGGNRSGTGGGIISINTPALTNDGAIRANGVNANGCCDGSAGGSIWIRTTALSGSGSVEATGSNWDRTGGGGAVAIEYSSVTGTMLANFRAYAGGNAGGSGVQYGGAGSIYLKGPSATYGTLTINNNNHASAQNTELPSLGSGIAQSGTNGNTLVTDRASNIPAYFNAHWIEIRDSSGVFKGLWRVTAINARTVTLTSDATVSAGDQWRGVYRFDAVTVTGNESMLSVDPILIGANHLQTVYGTTQANTYVTYSQPITGDDISIIAHVAVPQVKAANLSLESGAVLTSLQTSGTTAQTLSLDVTGSINVKPGASIDLTGRGYAGGVTYPGATAPGNYSSGAHIGVGGYYQSPLSTTFGSVYQPLEAGGGGNHCCGSGGGAVAINTPSLTNDGTIRANGVGSQNGGCCDGGAGGSVWIKTTNLTGNGTVEAIGGAWDRFGGGGAIAIEYANAGGTMLNNLSAWTGGSTGAGGNQYGGAGSIYLKGPNATFGSLTINNNGHPGGSSQNTELPSLGSGIAQNGTSGNTLVTDRASNIPAYFNAHWIEIRDASGAFKGIWRVTAINAKTLTLTNDATVSAGDQWRGVYRFDAVTIAGSEMMQSNDPILIGANRLLTLYGTTAANQFVTYTQPIVNEDVSVVARVAVPQVKAANLSVENGGVLTSSAMTLSLDVSGSITVKSGGSLDVTGRGYAGGTSYPGATVPGNYSSGSHIGVGGLYQGPLGTTFGSIFQPLEAGGGGNHCCGSGGGVITLNAATLTNDGAIRANGVGSQFGGCCDGGAGGSIWLRTTALSGNGTVEAIGGAWDRFGGGGAIAIEYSNAGGNVLNNVSAWTGGSAGANGSNYGGAGSILIKGPGATFGALTINNNSHPPAGVQSTELPSLGSGTAQSGSSGATLITNRAANIPAYLVGHWVRVRDAAGNLKGTWQIVSVNAKTATLTSDATVQPGDTYRGVYRLDSLKLRSAKLTVEDLLDVTTPFDLDASSSIAGNNQGPPVFNPALITLSSTATGSSVIGTAGAVTDADKPVTLTATNTTSGNTYPGTANADGSFTIPVQGNAGETIVLKAKDGNIYPLESPVITIGQLSTGTPTTSQIDRSTWTSDGGFRARRLVNDASRLLVASNVNSGSDKLVVLGITDPARPALQRTVTINNGPINDLALTSSGWAVVASYDLMLLDLNNPSSTAFSLGDPGWYEYAVTLSNGYAFTAVNAYNDGRIRIYDISTPTAAHHVRDQALIGSVTYRGLTTMGNYLIAFTPDKPNGVGHDVVVIDISNIYSMVKVGDIDIPNFDAYRGYVLGTKVYVTSQTSPDVYAVDLANPAAPVVLGKVTVGGNAGGIGVIKNDAFVAAGSAGLVDVDISNPAALTIAGASSTTGTAYDVALQSPYAYVANDLGLAIVPITTAPQIEPSRVSMSLNGATLTLTGGPRSITGSGAITVEAKDVNTGTIVSGQPVASDGTFSISIAARAGDAITIEATDASARKSGPVSLGIVPFGSAVTVLPITPAISEPGFHARTLATDGTNLIVGGYSDGGSTKVLLYDVTNPSTPVYKRTVAVNNGSVFDVAITNGYALIGAADLSVLDLSNPNSTPVILGDPGWYEYNVVVGGGYAFTSVNAYNDGRIRIYDVSSPAASRYVRDQTSVGSTTFYGLATYGTKYLLAFSSDRPNGVGHDLVVFDRTNINNLVKIADIDIGGASFNAFRGKVAGSTLFLAGTNGGVAVVDLSNPAAPVVNTILPMAEAYGVDSSGSTVAVADGGAGVTFLDATNPAAPVKLGTQAVGGSAWSVLFNRGNLYVANEQGLAVIQNIATAPLIDASLISITATTGTTATVTGAARSISGVKPLTFEVKNATSGASISGQSVAADGSFSVLITGAAGDLITVEATDPSGRTSGAVQAGHVPFGAGVSMFPITPSISEPNFRARTLATDGTNLLVGGYADGNSTKVLLYDVTDPATPVYKRTVTVNNGSVFNMAITKGYALIAAADLSVLDLSSPTSTPVNLGDPGWYEYDVVVSGGYAFTSVNAYNDGRIRIYDVNNPTTSRYVRDATTVGSVTYYGLATLDTQYLLAFTSDRPNGVGHDLVVLDRSNIYSLVKVADIDIGGANFNAYRGKVVGNTLYLAGTSGGMAVVDLTNPKVPVVKQIIDMPGTTYGVDGSGSLVIAADGGAGVTFLDATNAANPVVVGSEVVGGNAWSVAINRGNIYVANEQGLAVIRNVGSAPIVSSSLVTISADGTGHATVTGAATAVTGVGSLTIDVRDATTGTIAPAHGVNGDGSFSASLAANPGDTITVEATDAAGRKSGAVVVGTVPFGSGVLTIPITPSISEANYHPRTVATDGKFLIVGGYQDGGSTKLLVFDIATDPANPTLKRSVALSDGPINQVAIQSGYAIVAANDLMVLDLNNPASTPVNVGDPGYYELDLAIADGFAFTAVTNYNDGRIRTWDVANPATPHSFHDQTFIGSTTFSGLTTYGTGYLIATSGDKPNGVGHDVVVFDRREPNALVKIADLDIPAFDGYRGKVVGNTLYLAGVGGGVAVVDLSDPKVPVLKMVLQTAGDAFGADGSGSTVAIADGSAGVTFLDITNPFVPVIAGTQPVGGNVWSVAFSRGNLYAVNEQALVVVQNVATSPIVDRSLLALSTDGSSTTITGAAKALTGVGPLTLFATNTSTNTTSGTVTAGNDGSFLSTLAALPGSILTLTAKDAGNRTATVALGQAPFGSVTTYLAGQAQAANDAGYRARRVATDGTVALVTNGSTYGLGIPTSRQLLIYNLSNGTFRNIAAGNGVMYDLTIANGYAYFASDDLGSLNLSDPNATVKMASDPGYYELSVAVQGTFAYTAVTNYNDGRVRVYNISNPAVAPVHVRDQSMVGSTTLRKILKLSSNYLVAITPDRPNGVGHDVIVIDATNPNAMVKTGDFDIPAFNGFDGAVDGATLYVVGDAGVAIVDLSNPAAPVVKSIVKTPGIPRGVAVSGTDEIAIADGSGGVTFVDVSSKTSPVIKGTQQVTGNTAGVAVTGKTVFAASDQYFNVISRP